MRRFGYALCLAAAVIGVLATRVELGVQRIRHRVVTAPVPASGTTLIVRLPEMPRLAGTRAAVVARLRGPGAAGRIVMSLDGEPVAETAIPTSGERRVDWSFVAPSGPGHQVGFTGDVAGWTLLYLEIANIHGFSRGVIDFAIVPRGRPRMPLAPGWLLALAGLGALALAPRRNWPGPGPIRVLHRVASAAVLAALGAAVVTEWVSRFAVVLSLHTFVLGAAVLYAEPLARAWHGLRRLESGRRASRLLPHFLLTAMFVWCTAGFYDPATGFTSFVRFGREFGGRALPVLSDVPHATEPGWGYDGQFYAQLALDPLLQTEDLRVALDSPEYRGRRILFPAMAWVLGLGRPGLVLQVYSLLNVASWIVLACLLLRWLPAGSGRTLAAWAACLFSPGLLASVRAALPDGPGVLLLVVGLIAVERHRPWLAAPVAWRVGPRARDEPAGRHHAPAVALAPRGSRSSGGTCARDAAAARAVGRVSQDARTAAGHGRRAEFQLASGGLRGEVGVHHRRAPSGCRPLRLVQSALGRGADACRPWCWRCAETGRARGGVSVPCTRCSGWCWDRPCGRDIPAPRRACCCR